MPNRILVTMSSQDTSFDSGSSDSSVSDLRRRRRDTRPRPWLTNSVLRGRSPSPSGADGSMDAPMLSEVTTVPLAPTLPPSVPVVPDREGAPSRDDNTKKERDSSRLSRAAAKAKTTVKALAKAAGSKIPRWVGLKGVASRKGSSPSIDGEDMAQGGGKPATSPTGTGETTSASRLPVRAKDSLVGRRPAAGQVRFNEPLGAHAVSTRDKGVGKRGTGGSRGAGGVGGRGLRGQGPAEPNQSCFGPEPIRTHRREYQLTSILKHRPGRSGEAPAAKAAAPTSSSSRWYNRGKKEKLGKKVFVLRRPTFQSPARCFPKTLYKGWVCDGCGLERCNCPATRAEGKSLHVNRVDWLVKQLQFGCDYLELSGGMWCGEMNDPLLDL
ncbi:hypothetical protein ABEF95_010064 [Exophiala dermatitidis]